MRYFAALAAALIATLAYAGDWYCTKPVKLATSLTMNNVSSVDAPLSLRKTVTVCNSIQNSTGGIVKCREDGVDPIMATTAAGDALNPGDCATYKIEYTTRIRCTTNSTGTVVTTTECR